MDIRLILLGALVIWNVLVFIFYAVDKYKAVHHLWRIPEKVLILQSILAGGVGAVLAGQIVHHKTRKWYFWVAWCLGLVVDIALVLAILTLGA